MGPLGEQTDGVLGPAYGLGRPLPGARRALPADLGQVVRGGDKLGVAAPDGAKRLGDRLGDGLLELAVAGEAFGVGGGRPALTGGEDLQQVGDAGPAVRVVA